MSRSSKKNRKNPLANLRRQLHVEVLEGRALPSCNMISGFVYYDANNDGLYDQSTETSIADSPIELHDVNGAIVGSTITDANGYYQFEMDITHPTLDSTLVKTVTFDPTQTNFSLDGFLDQFDPSLGLLEAIEIQHTGSITSEISVENYSNDSESDISGTVSGTMTLTGPGLDDALNISGYAGSFHAEQYDGDTDFSGTSGESFGEQTADGANTITLTGSDLDAYLGAGQVQITETAVATSSATGGGNLDVRVRSTGQSTVTVTYFYKAYDCLAPGDYTIIQTQQPDGYTDGLESMYGVVDPNSVGTDQITVFLDGVDLPNNDFGELKSAQLSGHVWHDANNDGVRDLDEALIPDVFITLDTAAGPMQTTTDANGYYEFLNLQPGTYTVREMQPTDYLDGMDLAGTLGGTVVNDPAEDQIQEITLQAGDDSQANDFGEIKPSSIAGHVYYDANDNGTFDPGELPISGATVTLTGFDDAGPIGLDMQTDLDGSYKFENLRPGTYALVETQPASYRDGQDTIGTPGGISGNDNFSDIALPEGFDGVDNDFGEIKSSPPTPLNPLPKKVGPLGMLPLFNIAQRTLTSTLANYSPQERAQMTFAVGATMTLTGEQLGPVALLYALQGFQTGTTTPQYVACLWATDAHRQTQVNSIYKDIFNRMPTGQEQAQAVAQLQSGADPLTVREDLYVSSAFQDLHPTTEELAIALSQSILQATPDSGDVEALLLSMGVEPLSTVVHTLLYSEASLGNLVNDAYRLTLRRPATTVEIQTWTPKLQAGTTTLDQLSQRLLSSQEFYRLAFNRIH
ncbi:MAG: choice-of-anchor E domain-containing protein [Gemmataceae bacterium]|nr:choice-of-anchor E domain-containing protein [Gemmataceae bacterium]